MKRLVIAVFLVLVMVFGVSCKKKGYTTPDISVRKAPAGHHELRGSLPLVLSDACQVLNNLAEQLDRG